MNSATAFGMNGNNVMVGGEAGREAILPLNRSVLGDIGRGIVRSTNLGTNEVSTENRLLNAINDLANRENVIILDSGELVGATHPYDARVSASQKELTVGQCR